MKKIVINEYQLNKMLLDMERNYTSGKYFINEMPYTPKDFLILADTSARKAYIHLAKIFLFGDSTRNAKDWLSQVINNFTIPMITSSVSKSVKLTKKGVKKAYLTNFFDDDFSEYEAQMEIFCKSAIDDVQNGSQRLYKKDAPPHLDIKDAITRSKPIITSYCNLVTFKN